MNPKPILNLAIAGVALGAFALGMRPAVRPADAATAAPAANATSAAVKHGEYLAKIMGCNDCHTPFHMTERGPEPDMTRMLSGHPQDVVVAATPKPAGGLWIGSMSATNTAWAGPWGVSFTANLTPDPETGLGKWTADTFIATIRNGKHEGVGRPILPPMPWPMYRNASDEDLRALFSYLQSIPAIKNRVPQPLEPAETN